MRFRLVPKSSTLDDLELRYVQIFSEFCASWHVSAPLLFGAPAPYLLFEISQWS